MARPQRWLVVVILMMCAVSHLCIADEQLIDLNGEKSDDLLSRHSEGMSEVFEEGPLGGAVTTSAPASELPLESANKDSNAKSEVLGAKSEVLGEGEGEGSRRRRRRRAPKSKVLTSQDWRRRRGSQIRPARPTPPRPTPPPTLDPKLWAGTDTLQLKDFRAGTEPESVMYQNKLEEGVTCRGGIPKACLSKGSVEPTGQDVCKITEGQKLKGPKVAVYAVDPSANNCKGLPAGFGTAKLELRNVQCECPTLTGCYNTEQVKNEQTGRKDDKRVMVKMDSKSTATIGGNSLDTDFKFDCYVAALQQVMDRAELRASAKEQEKAYSGKGGSAAGGGEEFGEDDEDDELAGLGGIGGGGATFVALPTVKFTGGKGSKGGRLGEEQTAGRRGGSFSPQQKFSLSFANRAGNDEELEELDDLE